VEDAGNARLGCAAARLGHLGKEQKLCPRRQEALRLHERRQPQVPAHGFTLPEVRDAEAQAQACGMFSCNVRHSQDRIETITQHGEAANVSRWIATIVENGSPMCPVPFENQFSKWVSWSARQSRHLHRRAVGLEGWNGDNHITVDRDTRAGHGPETVTFTNVPPGEYQIAADQYSDEHPRDIKQGRPQVDIYLGNNVKFTCRIAPRCRARKRVWNVATIKVTYAGEGAGGKRRYRIEIRDTAAASARIRRIGLATSETRWNVSRRVQRRQGSSRLSKEPYFQSIGPHYYSDEYLRKVCHGRCRRADSTDPVFDSCLATPRLRTVIV